MNIVPSPNDRCNSGFTFMGTKPLLAKGLDEASTAKRLAGALARTNFKQLRFSQRHGWLYRSDEAASWRKDAGAAKRLAREFCHAASEQLRSPMLTAPALIAEVQRLAAFEPPMRQPVRDDELDVSVLAARGRA